MDKYIYSEDLQELINEKKVDEVHFDTQEFCITFEDGSVVQVFPNSPGLEVYAGEN